MHFYLDLRHSGREQEAKDFFSTIKADSNTIKIGHNYLNSCAPNSILITVGDNDTYPIWYVQEKENFRRDVTVLNYSLLAFAPYLSLLKRDGKIKFSTSKETFGDNSFNFFYRSAPALSPASFEKGIRFDSKEFISMIQTAKFKRDDFISFPGHSISLRVDTALYRKNFKQSVRNNE